LQAPASSHPGDKSDDNEEAGDPDRDNGAGHCDAHRYPNEGHAGGLMLFVKRVRSSESSGSATSLVSIVPHVAHSNIRFSEWLRPRTILANRIRVKHLTQRGRSIGERAASILLPRTKNSRTPARRLSDPRHKASGNLLGIGPSEGKCSDMSRASARLQA
jgi:hypothetical protein